MKEQALAKLREAYAAIDSGASEGHELRLAEAAGLLWEAYGAGAWEPDVVWPLKQLWTDTGHLGRVVDLLKDYLAATQDARERFLAGHYIVDTYALMAEQGVAGSDESAVEHHRGYIAQLGPAVPAWLSLWSLSDYTMMSSWQRTGQIDGWLALSLPLYEQVAVTDDDSRRAVAFYLRTLASVRAQQGDPAEALTCAERMLRLYRGDESPEALWLIAGGLGHQVELYRRLGDTRREQTALRVALTLPGRVEAARRRAPAQLAGEYGLNGFRICHDLGCILMWKGEPESAISLFEQALRYREHPMTRFWYAGVLFEARSDREGALANLRRAASDPRSSLIHRFGKAFLENASFAAVHDDPEFLAIVQEAAHRYRRRDLP